MRTMHRFKDFTFIKPVSADSGFAGNPSNFACLALYNHATIVVRTGTLVGAGPACTMQQAKNVDGNGVKALSFSEIFQNNPDDSPDQNKDLWFKQTVADTFTLEGNTNYRIEIDVDELDVDGHFDCIRPQFTAPGTTILIACYAELHSPRYMGDGSLMPSAAINHPA